MVSNAMRQLEERHMASKIDLIVWSHKMDLLALSNSKGEVCLHRLNWQKAWSLPPPAEGVLVKGIAWRPDGKVIAIGYTNGDVVLVNVENKDVIQVKSNQDANLQISLLVWIEDNEPFVKTGTNIACSSVFLPKLPPISRSFSSMSEESNEEFEDIKLVQDQASLNFLIVATSDGCISVNIFGLLPCGNLYLPENLRQSSKIVSVDMSSNLNYIFVTVECADGMLRLITYDSRVISENRQEIHFLAYKHGMLMSLMDYLENTMHAINEAYENMLLLEMESKFSKYAQGNPDSSISTDLLELLVMGVMSDELEMFLSKELTAKGIKKLGHSIELSHCNIQKLILKHIQAVCNNIVYHLSDFLGMSRLTERFQVLGVDEATVIKTYKETGSFLMKANELQIVIDISLKQYKTFFKWMKSVMELIQYLPSASDISQQEVSLIAEYLYSLDSKNCSTSKKYCLDRVGQYLQDKELEEPLSMENNPWETLVKNTKLLNNEIITVREEKLSLIQQFRRLQSVTAALVKLPGSTIGGKINLLFNNEIGSITRSNRVSTVVGKDLIIAYCSDNNLNIVRVNTDSVKDNGGIRLEKGVGTFEGGNSLSYRITDYQFYLESTLSVLLAEATDEKGAVFLQFPIANIEAGKTVDVRSTIEPGWLRQLDNMVGGRLAVSGGRKVAVVVSENGHKVRTYEMEVEEDEEEDEEEMDHTSSLSHIDTSATSLNRSI